MGKEMAKDSHRSRQSRSIITPFAVPTARLELGEGQASLEARASQWRSHYLPARTPAL